ncbi:MAG TPA: hypothetical protein VMU94_14160 [Streptosporangiaceae bacterium]|nr:hypothetical protein [Streptosporangiaceae bacterium]
MNIRFSEDELEGLRRQARVQGTSMTTLAHDLVVGRTERAQHNALVLGASARVMGMSEELLKRLADR